jgi:sodium/bile acid cotransporter 7
MKETNEYVGAPSSELIRFPYKWLQEIQFQNQLRQGRSNTWRIQYDLKSLKNLVYFTSWIRANAFIAGLFCVVVLAFLFPEPGANGGWLHAESHGDWGLALIMFLPGLSMPFEKARQAAGNWRLHILIQSFTFVIFPVVGFLIQLILPLIWRGEPAVIQEGFLYLCVLPFTVSTSVVYTSVAGGNTAAAVFRAALSNILGVFLTPALVGILMQVSGRTSSFGLLFLQIILLTLVPFVVGIILRPLGYRSIDQNKNWVNRISNAVILFIVYGAFCLWDRFCC